MVCLHVYDFAGGRVPNPTSDTSHFTVDKLCEDSPCFAGSRMQLCTLLHVQYIYYIIILYITKLLYDNYIISIYYIIIYMKN